MHEKSESTFHAMLPDFRKSIVVWEVPRLRPFVLLLKTTYIGVSKSFETCPIDRQPMAVVNACAVLGSRERRHSVCRVASLCDHWELHNTSVCHHVCLHFCDFSMDVKLEQTANIQFCVKLGNSRAETFEMIRRAYGNEAMSRARCFEWHARFKRSRTSLEDDERS